MPFLWIEDSFSAYFAHFSILHQKMTFGFFVGSDLARAACHGNEAKVQALLQEQHADYGIGFKYALESAAEHGLTDVVKLLTSDRRFEEWKTRHVGLPLAAKNGHLEIVKMFLVQPGAFDEAAFCLALKNNHGVIALAILNHRRGYSTSPLWPLSL
jgi:ankyrin repeat protein